MIDPSTDIGKLRLRVADFNTIPLLPDSVYAQTLIDTGGSLNRSAITISKYILGMLAHKTHRKLNQLEVWGAEAYKNYRDFLLLTVSNPAFMDISPIPYSASGTEINPLIEFSKSWNKNFVITQSQQLSRDADISPNDGTRTGLLGSDHAGWLIVGG